jgi:hypothetical protein
MKRELVIFIIMYMVLITIPFHKANGQEIYLVSFKAVDSNNVGISGALIQISGYGQVVTDENGTATVQLTMGTYQVSVEYMDVVVYSSKMTVSSSTSFELKCSVYWFDVIVKSADGTPLPNASVKAFIGRFVQTQTTNDVGMAEFKQLPKAEVRIKALYNGRMVGETSITLEKNSVETILSSYYYALSFHVYDLDGLPINGAEVHVAKWENSTDQTGFTVVYAKGGMYPLEVDLYGVKVYETSINVEGDKEFILNATASTLKLKIVDEYNALVTNYQLTLIVGNKNITASTDNLGMLNVKQIPHGEVKIATVGTPIKVLHDGSFKEVMVPIYGIQVKVEVLGAYALGYMDLRVYVLLGNQPLKGNATVTVLSGNEKITKQIGERGYVNIKVPVWLTRSIEVEVRAEAYGQTVSKKVSAEASLLIPFTIPLCIIPLVVFSILGSRYKAQSRLRSLYI